MNSTAPLNAALWMCADSMQLISLPASFLVASMRCPGALPNAERLRCKKAIFALSMMGMIGSGVPSGEHHRLRVVISESRTDAHRGSGVKDEANFRVVEVTSLFSYHTYALSCQLLMH